LLPPCRSVLGELGFSRRPVSGEVWKMSVYEFSCRDCKKKFQEVVPIADYDPKGIRCPKCKSKKVDRIWGTVNVNTSKKS